MNTPIDLANFAITSAGFAVSLLGLCFAIVARGSGTWENKFFTLFFGLLVLYTSTDILVQLSIKVPGFGNMVISKAALFAMSFFSSLLMPGLTSLMLHYVDSKAKKKLVIRTVTLLWLIYFVILIVAQFTDFIYYFTPDNVYHRGLLYPVLLVPAAFIMADNILWLIGSRNCLKFRQFNALIFFNASALLCMLIQMFFYGIHAISVGVSVATLVLFLVILSDKDKAQLLQQRTNARQQASIAVLEMRPHFIYNTLMSIYYLCGRDPEAAQQTILNFSSYLRKNFTAIVGDEMIPFSEELEHTRAYLAVESVRFEDMLSIEFDTPFVNFRIPPLTLQPLVENAVKHGLDPDGEPLHIIVRSRETDDGYLVIVEDNGTGFREGKTGGSAAGNGGSVEGSRMDSESVRGGSLGEALSADGDGGPGGTLGHASGGSPGDESRMKSDSVGGGLGGTLGADGDGNTGDGLRMKSGSVNDGGPGGALDADGDNGLNRTLGSDDSSSSRTFIPTENGSHIALDNIRERLRLMCGGRLEISSRSQEGSAGDSYGTVVTIYLPRKKG